MNGPDFQYDGLTAFAPITNVATDKKKGLLSAADKAKIDNLWTPDNASGTQTFTDFNAVAKTGHYNAFGPANSPSSAGGGDGVWYMLIHTEHTGLNGYRWQLAYNFVSTNPTIYSRNKSGGTWSAWRVINEDSGWIDATPYFAAPFGSWGGWPVRFRRLNGVVHWDGMITQSATVTTAGTVILNLPAGYGATNSQMCRGAASADSGIFTIGGSSVNTYGTFTASNWVSMSGISYPTG